MAEPKFSQVDFINPSGAIESHMTLSVHQMPKTIFVTADTALSSGKNSENDEDNQLLLADAHQAFLAQLRSRRFILVRGNNANQ